MYMSFDRVLVRLNNCFCYYLHAVMVVYIYAFFLYIYAIFYYDFTEKKNIGTRKV